MLPVLLDVLIIAFPAIPLFFLGHNFPADWQNHLWEVGYYGEYFRNHFSFPPVINTPEVVGMPYPIFYGQGFYPVMGTLSAVLSANITVRLVMILLFALQFYAAKNLFMKLTRDGFVAKAVGALCVWTIYPLSNLYNRGAITEFVAAALLQCAVCWLLEFLVDENSEDWPRIANITAAVALVLGTHTITALYGGMFIGALTLLVGLHLRRNKKKFAVSAGAAGFLCLLSFSSWLYAMFLFHDKMLVSQEANRISFVPGVDGLFARLALWPYDPRTAGLSGRQLISVSTGYLDAQLNMPLLLLALFCAFRLWRSRPLRSGGAAGKRLALLGGAGFAGYLVFSVTPSLWGPIPGPLQIVQFGYRLVTYCNLSLIVALFGIFLVWKPRRLKAALIAVLILSAAGVALKIPRAMAYLNDKQSEVFPWNGSNSKNRSSLIHVSDFFYGFGAYSVQKPYPDAEFESHPKSRVKIALDVHSDPDFGKVTKAEFDIKQEVTGLLYIQAFPWNHFYVDGVRATSGLKHYRSFYAYDFSPGHHTLDYVFEPDGIWAKLRYVSLFVIFALLFGAACLNILRLRRIPAFARRRVSGRSPEPTRRTPT